MTTGRLSLKGARMFLTAGIIMCLAEFSAKATVTKPTSNGGLETKGAGLQILAYAEGWQGLTVAGSWDNMDSEIRKFRISQGSSICFEGQSLWKYDGKAVVGQIDIVCTERISMQSLSLVLNIPRSVNMGQTWIHDGIGQTIPSIPGVTGMFRSCTVPLPDGEKLSVDFDEPIYFNEQDMSRWSDSWTIRFGDNQTPRVYEKGEKIVFKCRVSSSDPMEMRAFNERYTIEEGAQWVKLRNYMDIVPGSALDFSDQGLQDAPAGRYGWLKAKGGSFEFEGIPGKEQRFYGINLCFTACYPTHEQADILTDRLVRLGYNSIRIHHHDDTWGKGDPEMLDRFDYLLAKAIEKGLYITTDMFVSRKVPWRDIDVDRDGDVEMNLFKTLTACYEPAFRNWCDYSRKFMEHLNPYTGRMYKDEPGMPLISLVNEGELFMGFASKAKEPLVQQAYKDFIGKDEEMVYGNEGFNEFSVYSEKRLAERGSAFLRGLGCKALLTNDNNGSQHGEGECATALYDYVDNHFYIDHPSFLDQSWRLPSRCDNTNPVAYGGPGMFRRGYAKGFSKPFTITEWNFSGPGKYRGLGGILTGAKAAVQDWDGLWRFAYSHHREDLMDNPENTPGYFDVATDPLSQASDRASICLFLRRDATRGEELQMDEKSGVLLLSTGRTCGIFADQSSHTAGPLTANISGAPGTICVSSLDGNDIAESKHLLLSHITDVQGEGAQYADADRKILLKWGKGMLLEQGEADICLALKRTRGIKVYELDTAGRRLGRITCKRTADGICFKVSTSNSRGQGQIYYEITTE